MQQPDQKELLEVLEKQKKNQLQVDLIFKIVLPIVAFFTECDLREFQLAIDTGYLCHFDNHFYCSGCQKTSFMALAHCNYRVLSDR